MFFPAISEFKGTNGPGTWYTWTRGDSISEGSAVPFQDVMTTVSKSMNVLNCKKNNTEQYNTLKQVTADLRRLLTDVYPKWTHRPLWSMSMPDSQEQYVYGLYNYARGRTSECLAHTHMSKAKKKVLAACMLNAAHQKLVASYLMGREDIALEGFDNLIFHHLLYAQHFEQLYDTDNSGIGSACAHAAEAVKIGHATNKDTSEAQELLNHYRSRNLVFETEKMGCALHLKII